MVVFQITILVLQKLLKKCKMTLNKTRKKIKNKNNLRKKTSLIVSFLKLFRIFKIIFTIFIVIITILFFRLLYVNNIFKKFINDIPFLYSKTFHKNICNDLEINGIDKADFFKIKTDVANFCELDNKNNLSILLNKIKQDPWIKNVSIRRILPNRLEINVEEYSPFAILKTNNRYELIDENGMVINISEREKRGYYNLIFITGDGAKENIYGLFNMLSTKPYLFGRIKSIIRIGNRRWNFELDNGIIIKMPENDIIEAWEKLDKIISIKGSEINIKSIDLRNKDKIFLEEDKATD